jgi:tRNA(Ile)-lysidine synthase
VNPTLSESSEPPSPTPEPATHDRASPQRATPQGLEQRLLARTRAAGFGAGDRLVVGFSGGRDSLALAAALRWVQSRLGVEPILVHIDHKLRSSSAEEAQRAAALAAALSVDFLAVAMRRSPLQAHSGVGLEEAARRERYHLLFAVAEERGARVVATAHHQQDQAETVLLHLLRGGGVHGAAGMAERSAPPLPALALHDISPETDTKGEPWLWRPFLDEPREAIDAYVARLGLPPIADPSNEDLSLRRNALRREIWPLLETHFPGATAALARYASLAAADDGLLDQLAAAALAGAVDREGMLDAVAVVSHPVALQRRMVRLWLSQATGAAAASANRVEAVLALARANAGGRLAEIGEGWTVRLARGMLRVQQIEREPTGGEE